MKTQTLNDLKVLRTELRTKLEAIDLLIELYSPEKVDKQLDKPHGIQPLTKPKRKSNYTPTKKWKYYGVDFKMFIINALKENKNVPMSASDFIQTFNVDDLTDTKKVSQKIYATLAILHQGDIIGRTDKNGEPYKYYLK